MRIAVAVVGWTHETRGWHCASSTVITNGENDRVSSTSEKPNWLMALSHCRRCPCESGKQVSSGCHASSPSLSSRQKHVQLLFAYAAFLKFPSSVDAVHRSTELENLRQPTRPVFFRPLPIPLTGVYPVQAGNLTPKQWVNEGFNFTKCWLDLAVSASQSLIRREGQRRGQQSLWRGKHPISGLGTRLILICSLASDCRDRHELSWCRIALEPRDLLGVQFLRFLETVTRAREVTSNDDLEITEV